MSVIENSSLGTNRVGLKPVNVISNMIDPYRSSITFFLEGWPIYDVIIFSDRKLYVVRLPILVWGRFSLG